MTFLDFQQSLSGSQPPSDISTPLLGLWYAAKGDWDKAHETVQDDSSPEAAWVHAHLHKQEGDPSNARYWYARSPRNTFDLNLDAEWQKIAKTLLADDN